MRRGIRTTLPTLEENLKPAWPEDEKVRNADALVNKTLKKVNKHSSTIAEME